MNETKFTTKTTSEVCDKLWIGLVTTMTKSYVEKGVPLIRNSDIKPNRINTDLINLDTEFANLHIGRTLRAGDVVTVHTGDVGVSSVIPQELNGAHGFATVNSRLKREIILPEYYCWYLNSDIFKEEVYKVITGDGRNNLNLNDFVNLKVRYPSLPDQRQISRILSICNAVLEKTQVAIAKYKAIKQGMLHDLFTRGIDINTGKLRPKYEDAPELYKESKLGWVPREWDVKTVSQLIKNKVLDEIQDGNHGEKHPKSSDFVPVGIPFIMASDISDDKIDLLNCHRIVYEQYKSLRIGFSKSGDVLLSHKASIGFVAKVPGQIMEIMLTPQVTYYRVLNIDIMYNEYLENFLRSESFQIPLQIMAKQSTRDYIGITMQKTLNLAYPLNLLEQRKISEKLSSINNTLQFEKYYLHRLQAIKKGLMDDLLSGRKSVIAEATVNKYYTENGNVVRM